MKAKHINEYIDYTGKWISDKKDPFDKARDYDIRKTLMEELLVIIQKYKGKLDKKIIVEVLSDIIRKIVY